MLTRFAAILRAPAAVTSGRSAWRALLPATVAFLAACADDGSDRAAPSVETSYAKTCELLDCGGQGVCSVAARGEPVCTCNAGYAGARCGSCALGFHRAATQQCVPDLSCAEQDVDLCGAHGSCNDDEGALRCDCAPAYEGARCELCASGYQRSPSGECLQLVIVIDGLGLPLGPLDTEPYSH